MFISSNNYTIIELCGHMVAKEGSFIILAGNQHDREPDNMLITIKTPIPVQKAGNESSKESAFSQSKISYMNLVTLCLS